MRPGHPSTPRVFEPHAKYSTGAYNLPALAWFLSEAAAQYTTTKSWLGKYRWERSIQTQPRIPNASHICAIQVQLNQPVHPARSSQRKHEIVHVSYTPTADLVRLQTMVHSDSDPQAAEPSRRIHNTSDCPGLVAKRWRSPGQCLALAIATFHTHVRQRD